MRRGSPRPQAADVSPSAAATAGPAPHRRLSTDAYNGRTDGRRSSVLCLLSRPLRPAGRPGGRGRRGYAPNDLLPPAVSPSLRRLRAPASTRAQEFEALYGPVRRRCSISTRRRSSITRTGISAPPHRRAPPTCSRERRSRKPLLLHRRRAGDRAALRRGRGRLTSSATRTSSSPRDQVRRRSSSRRAARKGPQAEPDTEACEAEGSAGGKAGPPSSGARALPRRRVEELEHGQRSLTRPTR